MTASTIIPIAPEQKAEITDLGVEYVSRDLVELNISITIGQRFAYTMIAAVLSQSVRDRSPSGNVPTLDCPAEYRGVTFDVF